MFSVVIDTLLGADKLAGLPRRCPGVQVAIELGKSAGCNLHTDTVSGFENLAGIPAIEAILINLARLDQRGMLHAIAETGAHHTITETLAKTIGPDIDQHGHE